MAGTIECGGVVRLLHNNNSSNSCNTSCLPSVAALGANDAASGFQTTCLRDSIRRCGRRAPAMKGDGRRKRAEGDQRKKGFGRQYCVIIAGRTRTHPPTHTHTHAQRTAVHRFIKRVETATPDRNLSCLDMYLFITSIHFIYPLLPEIRVVAGGGGVGS